MDGVVEGVFTRWMSGPQGVECRVRRRRHRDTVYDVEWRDGNGRVLYAVVDLSDPWIRSMMYSLLSRIPKNIPFTGQPSALSSSSPVPMITFPREKRKKENISDFTSKIDENLLNVPTLIDGQEVVVGYQVECSDCGSSSRVIPLPDYPLQNPIQNPLLGESTSNEEKEKKKRPRNFAALVGEKQTFVCQICFLSFSRSFNLRRHIESKHDAPLHFTCPYCEKDYKHARHFADHTRRHLGRHFECELCDEKMENRNGLRAHMRRHGKESEETEGLCHEVVKTKKSRVARTYPAEASELKVKDPPGRLQIPVDFGAKL